MYKIAFTLTAFLLITLFLQYSLELKRRKHRHRYRPRIYNLTFSIRNHNISAAKFFQIRGPGHTAYFRLFKDNIFTQTFIVRGKGNWILFVEFGNNFYARSRPKIISRDSYPHWFMELYSYRHTPKQKEDDTDLPDAVGFTDWEKVTKQLQKKLAESRGATDY